MFDRNRPGQAVIRFVIGCIVLVGVGRPVSADSPDVGRQQLWFINARSISSCDCGDLEAGFEHIRFWQLSDDCRWASETKERFLADDRADVPTVIFVHGTRTDLDGAAERGFRVYEALQQAAKGRPFRCAVWTWPSDREQLRPRPEMQRKMGYCEAQSRYLAGFLAKVKRETPLCLIGHSFGSRIIAGALDEMAGHETSRGREPSEAGQQGTVQRLRLRAMLLAAGIDCGAFLPGHRCEAAVSIVEEMMVTRNVCDRALHWYPRLFGRRGPQAMGAVGPLLNGGGENVEVVDVSCSVGREHDVHRYLGCGEFRSRLARYVFSAGEP